jgi:hypothetical protein
MNGVDMGKAPTKSIVEPGLEDFKLDLGESTPNEPEHIAIDPKEILNDDGRGNLVLVNELPEEGLPVIDTDEHVVAGLESVFMEELQSRQSATAKPSVIPIQRSPIYSAIISPAIKIFDLCGNCDMEADILVHMLYLADAQDTFKIVLGANKLTEFEILDLTSAILATKGRTELVVGTIASPFELSIVAECDSVTCLLDNMIQPIQEFHRGSTKNVETTLTSSKAYEDQMFAILQEGGILKTDEIADLKERRPVIIKADRLKK